MCPGDSNCSVECATSKWPGQAVLQVVEHAARPRRVVKHSSVTTTCAVRIGQRRGERPGVQVVHRLHLGQLHQVAAHLLEVDVLGRRLQQDAQRRPQQLHRGLEHEEDDDERRDGVGPVEAADAR